MAQNDRRLVSTELWLVERLRDGQERNQAIAIRSQFYGPAKFYVDSLVAGRVTLDFHGQFVVSPVAQAMDIDLTIRSRVVQGDTVSMVLAERPLMRARAVDSSLRLTPGEVVDVALLRLGENDAGSFANRSYSIRVRSRQIR